MNLPILPSSLKFFDIAANLCDDEFEGIYHEKKYHSSDVNEVLFRAEKMNVTHMLFSAGSINDIIKSYELSLKNKNFFISAGIHPCRASEELKLNNNNVNEIFKNLENLIVKFKDKIITIGECGLDYDRFNYSNKEDQNLLFNPHFNLAQKYNFSMYFHNRNTNDDFFNVVKENRNKFNKGIVHSFTGNENDLNNFLSLNLFIGLTGTSFKTKENIEIVKKIPLDKIIIETDAPYCEIKKNNEGFKYVETFFEGKLKKEKMKKGFMCKERNEPCTMIQVLEVVSKVKNVDKNDVAKICYQNAFELFGLKNE